MTKIALIAISLAAAVTAVVLLTLGWRRVYVDDGARRTLRGRFLVAVAFFLATFAGYADRLHAADAPPAGQTQQQLSLAEMQKAVESILTSGPSRNDWHDPDISPNVQTLLEKTGLFAKTGPRVMCYDRAAVPAKARSEELAALQKQLLDEKVEAGIITEEVAQKITAIPEPNANTTGEVRTYQLKVRRTTRLLYQAGELDTATLKKLEGAIQMPIANLDPLKSLRADVSYAMQAVVPWRWPAEVRREFLDVLAKQEIINKPQTHRGEFEGGKAAPDELQKAREEVDRIGKLIADPKTTVKLKGDDGAKPVVLNEAADVRAYRLKVRHAVRILMSEKLLTEDYDDKPFTALLGIPLFGAVATPLVEPPMCYMPALIQPKDSSRLAPSERRELRDNFARAGVLPAKITKKLDQADAAGT